MMQDRFGPALGVGGATAILFYWIVSAAVKMGCRSNYLPVDYSIDSQATAALVAVGFGFTAFAFCFAVFGEAQTDKFEKLAALGLLIIAAIWITFVLLDGDICSATAWKRYAAYLIAPSLIGSIAVVGRRWISKND
jgi:hypothetical protein